MLAALASLLALAAADSGGAFVAVQPLSPPPSDEFLIACAQRDPACDAVWAAPTPPLFTATVPTTRGAFTVAVNTSWAPAMAARFYVLALLSYWNSGPFYRVLAKSPAERFVAQFGYRGAPAVDGAWVALQTSNATSAVVQGNARGTIAFGTYEVPNGGGSSNCSAAQCSRGFSVELFINLADNARLDAADFSPFGAVDAEGMRVVDALHAVYGELSDLCAQDGSSPYCVKCKSGGYAGVNFTRFLAADGGWGYLRQPFPLLDRVLP